MYEPDTELFPAATFAVVEYQGGKIFDCGGVRFSELPANLFAPDSSGHIVELQFERAGVKHRASLQVSIDFPNGVAGRASCFDFPELDLRDERVLKASSLEVGDNLALRRLPVSFWPDVLVRLRPQLTQCIDWCESYDEHYTAYHRMYDAIRAKRTARTRKTCDIETNILVIGFRELCRLWFLNLKNQNNLPAWLDLCELETV